MESTHTDQLYKSTRASSGIVWEKNWGTFISNIDYEILQWSGNAPKKQSVLRVFRNPLRPSS
jgi:hypothetical protein